MTEPRKPFRKEGNKERSGNGQQGNRNPRPYGDKRQDGFRKDRSGEGRSFARPARPGDRRPAQRSGNAKTAQRSSETNVPNTTPARKLALEVLCEVHQKGAFANLCLNEKLQAARWIKPEDRRLATGLVYGVLENQIRIDYALKGFIAHQVKEPAQTDSLRMGAYQILFLDRVPDHAAVDEAVKLTRAMGMESSTGFVNAVLRNLSRQKNDLKWPVKEEDRRTWLHVMTSTPLWLVERIVADYGEEEAEKILFHREETPCLTVRPNLHTSGDEELIRLLKQAHDVYGQTIVMVTHDETLLRYGDRVYRMESGTPVLV